jgi:hypothetical protein
MYSADRKKGASPHNNTYKGPNPLVGNPNPCASYCLGAEYNGCLVSTVLLVWRPVVSSS